MAHSYQPHEVILNFWFLTFYIILQISNIVNNHYKVVGMG
jgi:hypothetical protein